MRQEDSLHQDEGLAREIPIQQSPIFFHETLEDKLERREKLHFARINQPVAVRNLYLRYERRDSFGEMRLKKPKSSKNRIKRILKHIDNLANVANQEHIKEYFYGGKLLETANNKVTRINLNEFALFTKDYPLSEDEINKLLAEIEKIAARYHTNVHLSLGTIGCATSDGRLFNMAIYVQCGANPEISTVTKSHPIKEDPRYDHYAYSSREEVAPHSNQELSVMIAKEGIVAALPSPGSKVKAVNYNPLIVCKTKGGAEFIVGIDICYDHEQQHTRRALLNKINLLIQNTENNYLPLQREHLIISNTIAVTEEHLISQIYTQADPSYIGSHSSFRGKIEEAKVIFEEENPVFGAKFFILAFPEHALALERDDPFYDVYLEPKWKSRIDIANQKAMTARVQSRRSKPNLM